ncbi:MAG: hypothetical protein AB7F89_09595 [Pirellulaceae bacterium]
MRDPLKFLWPYAEDPHPMFADTTLRMALGVGLERLIDSGWLIPAENADTITCPGCLDGHEEEVVAVDRPDGTRQFYVPCPENLRLEVSPALLRQWTIDWFALARAMASSLTLGGACTPLVDVRLWRLGRTKWQGQSRDVLYARGLTWADGGHLASQVARTTRPIVFVGDRMPPPSIWPGRVPPIVALSQVTTLGESGLVVDHDAVLAAIFEADAMASSPSQEPVRTDQLALMIRRQIKAEGKTQLTDDILVAAYQQEGSVRKAAVCLSERTGQTVTKDKVQHALRRSGGIGSVVRRRNRKSDSIRR